ncbi:MAG: hypothetical protein JF613_08170 [Acidobacteria bacterium]|nr:hypothetical protein [Acidobacteriota bacterium]
MPEQMVPHQAGGNARRFSWLIAATLLATAIGIAADTSDAARALDRFPSLREQPIKQYRAYRRMHARSDHFNQEAWLEAWTEFDDQGFRYNIVSESGSDYIRGKVLKAVLKREQELVADGDCQRSELTAENYEFAEASEGNGERYVTIKPKRKDVLLVDGRMVLSPDGRELLRVEGRLSKNPSFWTSLVNVIRHYARVDGVRVPIATESIAKVKLAGVSYMDVHYEYDTINGRPVSMAARHTLPPVTMR